MRLIPSEVVSRLQQALAARGLDAALVMSPENLAYAAGVSVPSQRLVRQRHAACILPSAGEPELIVVDVEESYVRAAAAPTPVFAYNEFTEGPVGLLLERLRARGLDGGRLGFEATYLPVAEHRLLRRALIGAELQPVDELLAELRQVKTPEELERIRAVGRIAEETMAEALSLVRPGTTEAELARRIAEGFGQRGGEHLTMLVVASGERSSFANAPATSRAVRPGDLIRVDIIGTRANYFCDFCRTAVVGRASDEQRAVWQKLLDARNTALEAIRPGASTAAIYRAYRERMEGWGLPAINFLGHGLGVTLHEEPYLGRYGDVPLQAGMALCVEPLVWVADAWGQQLEDEVVVTADGCELVTGGGAEPRLLEVGG